MGPSPFYLCELGPLFLPPNAPRWQVPNPNTKNPQTQAYKPEAFSTPAKIPIQRQRTTTTQTTTTTMGPGPRYDQDNHDHQKTTSGPPGDLWDRGPGPIDGTTGRSPGDHPVTTRSAGTDHKETTTRPPGHQTMATTGAAQEHVHKARSDPSPSTGGMRSAATTLSARRTRKQGAVAFQGKRPPGIYDETGFVRETVCSVPCLNHKMCWQTTCRASARCVPGHQSNSLLQ